MLERVCAVLDFECFQHKTLLYYREIAFAPIDVLPPGKLINLHVTPDHPPLQYGDRALWKTFNTLKFHVHGMDIHPDQYGTNVVSQLSVPGIIRALHQYASTPDRYVIAYKGGYFERQMLQQLQIPYLNLEDVGCQTYSSLPSIEKAFYIPFDCGQHRYAIAGEVDHCAAKEVAFYRQWILARLDYWKSQQQLNTKTDDTTMYAEEEEQEHELTETEYYQAPDEQEQQEEDEAEKEETTI